MQIEASFAGKTRQVAGTQMGQRRGQDCNVHCGLDGSLRLPDGRGCKWSPRRMAVGLHGTECLAINRRLPQNSPACSCACSGRSLARARPLAGLDWAAMGSCEYKKHPSWSGRFFCSFPGKTCVRNPKRWQPGHFRGTAPLVRSCGRKWREKRMQCTCWCVARCGLVHAMREQPTRLRIAAAMGARGIPMPQAVPPMRRARRRRRKPEAPELAWKAEGS